jgi:isochorismate hydrolase
MNSFSRLSFVLALAAVLAGCESMRAMHATPASELPQIPSPVPVALDAGTTALLVLDFNTAVCQPNPACNETLPAVARLIAKARAAKVPVVYSTTPGPQGNNPTLPAVAPQAGEPVVVTRANKFLDTNLEELLKQRKATTLVITGTAANGAVLYSSFHANYRGFTVVVPEDTIVSPVPFNTFVARYQLLNQPGFSNPGNKPLAERQVTLSRSDLITFK